MSHDSSARSEEEIRQAAAFWFARMRSDSDDFDRAAFEAWLNEDPRHQAALDRMAEHYRLSGVLRPTEVRAPPRWRGPLLVLLPIAAALTLVYSGGLPRPRAPQAAPTGTPAGSGMDSTLSAPRQIALADGSTVFLDAGSDIQSEIGASERSIHLIRGRARFVVAHDPDRPFVVVARGSRVVAVGTIFDVDMRSAYDVDVSLIRGRVRVSTVSSHGLPPAAPILLSVGQRAAVASDGGIAVIPLPVTSDWTASKSTGDVRNFDHVTLATIAQDANAGSATKLRLGPDIGQIAVSGRFGLDDAPRLAASLAKGLDLEVSTLASGDILLQRKPDVEKVAIREVR